MTNYEKIKSLSFDDMAWFLKAIHEGLICQAACQYDKNGNPNNEEFIYGFPELVTWLDEPYDWTDDVWSNLLEDNLPMNNADRLQLMTPHDLAKEIWNIAEKIKLFNIKNASNIEYYLKQKVEV